MMKILQILFFVSCLTLASCLRDPSIFLKAMRYFPGDDVRSPEAKPMRYFPGDDVRSPEAKPMRYFPGDVRSPGQTRNSELQVPNEKICAEMQLLQSERLVLPWWYNYCASMYENQDRNYQDWMYENMGVYKSVLNQIDAYKRRKERQNHNMI